MKKTAMKLVDAFLKDAINFRGAKNNAIIHVKLSNNYEDSVDLIAEINKLDYID